MNERTDEHGYPFETEYQAIQQTPMPNIGVDCTVPSPLATKRLPDLKQEQKLHFERDEVQ
jgi:hypothetical protein